MKEKVKDLLKCLLFIGFGIFLWMMSDEYVFMLFHVIELDLRIVGGVCMAFGVICAVVELLPKGKKAPKASPAPRAAEAPRAQEQPRQAPAGANSGVNVRAMVTDARNADTAEAYREVVQVLERYREADPHNGEIVSGMLACYDGMLRTKGDRSFQDHQQRFYAALRAIYLEETCGKKPSTRRFWAIYNAVHGGIAAATARDLDQLEDAGFMLERAAGLNCEGDRDMMRQYERVAVHAVRCWVAYWIARITATEKPDYKRSAQALELAQKLCPTTGLQVCHMNPQLSTNTKVVLTQENLRALKAHLAKKAGN